MKNTCWIFCALFLFIGNTTFAQTNILDARQNFAIGTTATVTGVVTNGDELGPIRYIQDATGGIPIYNPTTASMMNVGDEVTVTGTMAEFRTLLQVSSVSTWTVNSSGNSVTPVAATPAGMDDMNESELVTMNGVSFENGGQAFSPGTHTFTDGTETGIIYLRSDNPLVGSIIPVGDVNLTGIVSIFDGVYQLLPRSAADLDYLSSIWISGFVEESNISTSGFDIDWTSNIPGSTNLRFGLTPALELGDINLGGMTANHSYSFLGLQPGTIYYVQVYSSLGTDVGESRIYPIATESNSSGDINVFFNSLVEESVAIGELATSISGGALEDTLIGMINQANVSIDLCLYNNDKVNIVAAVNEAHNRGVRVRYIANDGTANIAVGNLHPGINKVFLNSDNLMHNKFMVIDASTVMDSWIISGSTNWTFTNVNVDFNNLIMIQDQSLAKAYELEFNEMWGSDTAAPDVFNLKAGNQKTNNTPHKFVVGGRDVEMYFSPTDLTTSQIVRVMDSADQDLLFEILSFTSDPIGQAVIDAHNRGVDVRGINENTGDTGAEFANLQAAGVNVIDHPGPKSIHHKLAIIDVSMAGSDPTVITGSHNWSNGAETRNDENTLIIHDAEVANMYYQEFVKRWCEETEFCVTSIDLVESIQGLSFDFFPNPANDFIQMNFDLEEAQDFSIRLADMNGRILKEAKIDLQEGASQISWDISQFTAGGYFLILSNESELQVERIIIGR